MSNLSLKRLFLASLVCLIVLGRATHVLAQNQTGSVTVTVQGRKNEPMKGIAVKVMVPPTLKEPGTALSELLSVSQESFCLTRLVNQDGGRRGPEEKVVASGSTDDNGKVTLTSVPVGNYLVLAGELGFGGVRRPVAVQPGKDTPLVLKVRIRQL